MGRIVLTLGSFDGLHAGHLELLAGCRELAGDRGRVVAAVNPDEFIEAYKGRRPVVPYSERVAMLNACRLVDAVVCNAGGAIAAVTIGVVNPDVLAVGDDWLDPGHDERRYFAQLGVTPEWMAERGLRVEYIPRTTGVTSTDRRAASSLAEIAGNAAAYRRDALGATS